MDTYGSITKPSSDPPMTMQEMIDMIKSHMVKDDVRKSRTYFEMIQMEPCAVCGERVEYREKPYEHFLMCRHIAEHIPKATAPKMAIDVPACMRLDAMPVKFK